MASIRRNDLLHRRHCDYKFKCRPAKLDRVQNELNDKKCKIVKRIFLASSFDRWRKLRSSLKLKDSSLAWHLMEAHENGECSACLSSSEGDQDSENHKLLHASLMSCVRNFFQFEEYIGMIGFLCLDFGRGRKIKVRLQEIIKPQAQDESAKSLETTDPSPKIAVSASEKVDLLAPANAHMPSFSVSESATVSTSSEVSDVATDLEQATLQDSTAKQPVENTVTGGDLVELTSRDEVKGLDISSCSVESELSTEIDVVQTDTSQEMAQEDLQRSLYDRNDDYSMLGSGKVRGSFQLETMEQSASQKPALEDGKAQNLDCSDSNRLKNLSSNQETRVESRIHDHQLALQSPKACSSVQSAHEDGNFLSSFRSPSDTHLHGMAEDALAIADHPLDMSVMKSKPEEHELEQRNNIFSNSKMFSLDEESYQLVSSQASTSAAKRKAVSESGDMNSGCRVVSYSPVPKKLTKYCEETVTLGKISEGKNNSTRNEINGAGDGDDATGAANVDTNLETKDTEEVCLTSNKLSVVCRDGNRFEESTKGNQKESNNSESNRLKDNNHNFDTCSSRMLYDEGQTSNLSCLSSISGMSYQKSPTRVASPRHSSSLSTPQGHSVNSSPASCSLSSIPWQRRDMSRKEEYEFLEMHPFCDLAEFSARHPHVHQRTYYRWKRRIKEEFMVLEQCPDMSFSQFSGVVLQAKENVFSHWKSLIAQGKGFFAPSDSSKRCETKVSSSYEQQHQSAEYTFLQKNLSATFLDFSQHFHGASLSVFNALKQKSLQEFALLHQNKHMSYKEFSKLVKIPEDIFNEWQMCAQSLSQIQGSASPMLPSSGKFHPPDVNGFHPKTHQSNVLKNPLNSSVLSESHVMPVLNESMSRSLSASYLASLQNLMFPWPGYYGLGPQLPPQHLLPFMLWPGMMGGLAGASTGGPLALLSHLQSASCTSSPVSMSSGMQVGGTNSPKLLETKLESFEATVKEKNDFPANEGCQADQSLNKLRISSVDRVPSPQLPQQNDKEESNDSTSHGALNRSRKQNLQEYIHYLHRPELGFRELESLFPSISSRTFYRWRKEMNAAVLLIGEKPDLEFSNFHAVFPDIPEEIFQLWQCRAKKGESVLKPAVVFKTEATDSLSDCRDTLSKSDFKLSPSLSHDQKQRGSAHVNMPTKVGESDLLHLSSNINSQNHVHVSKPSTQHYHKSNHVPSSNSKDRYNPSPPVSQSHAGEELAQQKKCNKEEYLYVQQHPSLDFASFSRLFPNTSVRTFYRWKKELRDAVEFLRCNPTVDFAGYKAMDGSVSEEVFDVWKAAVKTNFVFDEHLTAGVDFQEEAFSVVQTDENYNTALSYLHLNPSINYAEFLRLFPEVKETTFDTWKEETNQIIRYIHSNPEVQFSDILSLLPHISLSSFTKWKEMAKGDADIKSCKNDTDDPAFRDCSAAFTKSQMTNAFVYLMYNPTISFNNYKENFPFVSPSTFELWLTKIRAVIVDMLSKPNIGYEDFNIKDMSPDLFDKLRSFGPEDLVLMDDRCKEARAAQEDYSDTYQLPLEISNTQLSQKAFAYLQTHPLISWEDFHTIYPSVSLEIFKDWTASITEPINLIKENLDLSYTDFSKFYPHTSQEVFEFWKLDISRSKSQNNPDFLVEGRSYCSEKDSSPMKQKNLSNFNPLDEKPNPERHSSLESGASRKDGSFARAESSLSKLAKFASGSAHLSPRHNSNATYYKGKAYLHPTEDSKCGDLTSSDDPLQDYGSGLDRNHHINSHEPIHTSHANISPNLEASEMDCSTYKYKPSLASLTPGINSYHRSQSSLEISSPAASDKGTPELPTASSTSSSTQWPSHSQAYPHQTHPDECGLKEEDEAFSSQRQKKMSRAEYMFVKANPEVDSQEFSRIFPGVSARTFYRWKKEIRAQLQLS